MQDKRNDAIKSNQKDKTMHSISSKHLETKAKNSKRKLMQILSRHSRVQWLEHCFKRTSWFEQLVDTDLTKRISTNLGVSIKYLLANNIKNRKRYSPFELERNFEKFINKSDAFAECDFSSSEDEKDLFKVFRHCMRIEKTQFPYQEDPFGTLFEFKSLYEEHANDEQKKMFKETFEMVPEEYETMIMVFIYAAYLWGHPITHQSIKKYLEDIGKTNLKDSVSKFLDEHSLTVEEYKQKYTAKRQKEFSKSIFDFNPLTKWPFIKIGDKYYLPIQRLLISLLVDGVYYKLLDEQHKPFLDIFGKSFEEYVGKLLKNSVFDLKLIEEDDLMAENSEVKTRFVDFAYIHGDTVYLIECKAGRIAIGPTMSDDIEDFKSKLKELVEKGSRQLSDVRKKIEDGRFTIGGEKYSKVKTILVSYENSWSFESFKNSPKFEEELFNKFDLQKPDFWLSYKHITTAIKHTSPENNLFDILEEAQKAGVIHGGFKEFCKNKYRSRKNTYLEEQNKNEFSEIRKELDPGYRNLSKNLNG